MKNMAIGFVLLLAGLFFAVQSLSYSCAPDAQNLVHASCNEKQGNLLFGGLLAIVGILSLIAGSRSKNDDEEKRS